MSRMQIIGDSVVVFGDNITQAAVTVYKAPPGMVGDALASWGNNLLNKYNTFISGNQPGMATIGDVVLNGKSFVEYFNSSQGLQDTTKFLGCGVFGIAAGSLSSVAFTPIGGVAFGFIAEQGCGKLVDFGFSYFKPPQTPSDSGSPPFPTTIEAVVVTEAGLDQSVTITFSQTNSNRKVAVVKSISDNAQAVPIAFSIEAVDISGPAGDYQYTAITKTDIGTGVISLVLRDNTTGNPVASGVNYVVNPNNTITFTTSTGTLQTTDLSNGKFLYQVQPDGSGLVAGPGGNDVYFGAGDTVTKTPNGVHIEFAAGGSTDVDTDVYGNPEITKTDIDGNRVIQSFNPDGTVAFTLERPAGFTPNNAVESLDDTMRSINMINASIGLTQTGTEPATAIQTITFDDGSTLTFGTDPATGQAVLSSTPSTDTTVGSGAGAGQYGTSTSSTISIAPNGTTQVTYNYAAGGSLIATTTTGGETVYTATTGVNTSPEGQPSNANVVYSVWTDSSGTPIVAGDGLAANEVATEQAGSLPAWNTKKCRMNQIFRSNNACSRRISYLRRYQKYKTRKFFHAKLQHMNVTAEIKTGQRRVIEYLLSPVQRAGGESLRER